MAAAGLIEGNIGKDGLEKYSGMDAMLSWFGFNTMKIGPYEMQNRVYWKQKEIDDIIKEVGSFFKTLILAIKIGLICMRSIGYYSKISI